MLVNAEVTRTRRPANFAAVEKNALGLSAHAQLPVELPGEVKTLVEQTKTRSGWPVRRTLAALEMAPGSYYRWRQAKARTSAPLDPRPPGRGSMDEVGESERRMILEYAMTHPEVRQREWAWKMLDDGVCAMSSSTGYRVLREANRVCRWKPSTKRQGWGQPPTPTKPDPLWQTDIRYTKVGERNYYLLSFLDAYSRYVVHHELLTTMDGWSVGVVAAAAIETLPKEVRPAIQSDHGSGFIAREFAGTLAEPSRKLQEAGELRQQENLKLRQKLTPWRQEEHLYSTSPVVSLGSKPISRQQRSGAVDEAGGTRPQGLL